MSNNQIILEGCIEQFKSENELSTNESETFELFTMTQITKSKDLSYDEIQNSIVDGGNDGGIDSILIFINDLVLDTTEDIDDFSLTKKSHIEIVISQCKKEKSFKEITLDKLITSLPVLFDLGKNENDLLPRFNPKIVEKIFMAREAWKRCSKAGGKLNISLNYCTFAEAININSSFSSKINQLNQLATGLFVGANFNYTNYSSEELLRLYQTHKNERLELTFKEAPLSTSFEKKGLGYVGTVKLSDFLSFIKDEDNSIRENLFESNIRHFQGGADVNEKIKATIENGIDEDFWWLNNGITIIASNPSLVGTTLTIEKVQIVNGLQTSYSIFLHHNGDNNDLRSVLVKVIINENKKTIDHIIASTNRQNPVSASLLRATDDIQREIELFFQNKGYFYDRRKNYYKNLGKPISKIFGIQTTAQAVEAIVFSNPHTTRSKPTSLIKDDPVYNKIFNKDYDYIVYLNSNLIVKKTADYYRTIENVVMKVALSNFKLHIARVYTTFVLNKVSVQIDDITNAKLSSYNQNLFDTSIQFIFEAIKNYSESNVNTNLINMAKTKQFTDFLIKRLYNKISSTSANKM
jgi:hypothetical protein